MVRVLEQAFVMMVVEHMLPFSFASDGETSFKRLAGAMCSGFPSLSARRVKHLVVEMYDATKKVRREWSCIGYRIENLHTSKFWFRYDIVSKVSIYYIRLFDASKIDFFDRSNYIEIVVCCSSNCR